MIAESSDWRRLAIVLIASGLLCPSAAQGQIDWVNPATGPAAGDWFAPLNWFPAIVPGSLDIAKISNGGEAKATTATAPGPVTASRLEVGKNASTGIFTSEGVSVSLGTAFDIGQIAGDFATGPVVVNSNGNATINDAPSLFVGTTGIGEVGVGKSSASFGAQASAVGSLTIERLNSITISGDLDIGQTSTSGTGASDASGDGDVIIRDVTGTLSIAGDIDAGSTGGVANAVSLGDGTLLIERLGALNVGGDLDVGQVSGAGQATGIGMVTIRDTANVTMGFDIDVAVVRTDRHARR